MYTTLAATFDKDSNRRTQQDELGLDVKDLVGYGQGSVHTIGKKAKLQKG